MRILGVMTGTSCDGLDASCVEFSRDGWRAIWRAQSPYPQELRKRVLALQTPGTQTRLQDLLALNRDLGLWYGKTLSRMIKARKSSIRPHVIANHGQTVAHFPAAPGGGTTLQLGGPALIAEKTGLTVVSQFRDGDQAVGGQGAPLVPLYHRLLAQSFDMVDEGVSIHNIGGISNLTYIGPNGKLLAFDTGPGNAWIDSAASIATKGKLKMDRGGRLALRAEIDAPAMRKLLKHPYLAQRAPKSTGRDDFPFGLLLKATRARDASLVATATAFTAETIARAYEKEVFARRLPLERIYLCGGGAKNHTLCEMIQAFLPMVEVTSLESEGFDPQYVESEAFAFFGLLSLRGEPLGGAWTGARTFGPPGTITPGRNWTKVLTQLMDMSVHRSK